MFVLSLCDYTELTHTNRINCGRLLWSTDVLQSLVLQQPVKLCICSSVVSLLARVCVRGRRQTSCWDLSAVWSQRHGYFDVLTLWCLLLLLLLLPSTLINISFLYYRHPRTMSFIFGWIYRSFSSVLQLLGMVLTPTRLSRTNSYPQRYSPVFGDFFITFYYIFIYFMLPVRLD